MSVNKQNRRDFLKTSVQAAAIGSVPFWFSLEKAQALAFKNPNDRPIIGCIGTGDRWEGVGANAMKYGDCVAVCDVDANHAGQGRDRVKDIQGKKGFNQEIEVHEDYRKILDRKDIEIVTIVTPDHWHSKIAIEAMQAGKDVYCEKPLTLTIDEGKQIRKVLDETKRVFQVGTQQRSEMGQLFLTAIAMIRDGRIGEVRKATCDIGGAPASAVLPKASIPSGLNWEKWLGQAPLVDYISGPSEGGNRPQSRCHYEFRWWYEYSGGKLTDWGAHHVDIAQWGLGMDHSGPDVVEPVKVVHPVPFKNGYPTVDNQYNTATEFEIRCGFANGAEIVIVHSAPDGNGVLFEGTEGRFHVSRSRIKGKPYEDLKEKPLPDGLIKQIYKGKEPGDHMKNFYECVVTREQPISDVHTHVRALTTCHLANIALRLDRKLNWDPQQEQIIGDPEARQWQGREQRKGYEINVPI